MTIDKNDLQLLQQTKNAVNNACTGLYLLNHKYGGSFHPEEYYIRELMYKLQKEIDKLTK